MKRDIKAPEGKLLRLTVESLALKGNPLGDSPSRAVDVYIPHGHDGRGLPLLVDLAGFTSSGLSHTAWKNFGENKPERIDRLIASGEMKPAVVAFPDCFTKLGGNQYINSAAIGRWADFLTQDMLPQIETAISCGGAGRRGLFGHSSGGYGAIVHAMLYPDIWAAAACHSGDMGFEMIYLPEMPAVLRALERYSGNIKAWCGEFFAKPKTSNSDIHVLMTLAMCASYDPDPGAPLGIRLPVDLKTCEIIPERWNNWLAWDPINLAGKHMQSLKRLKLLFIDCGESDQYNLLYGARRLHRDLDKNEVSHIYEEFPDNHSSIDYRLDRSLPRLAEELS